MAATCVIGLQWGDEAKGKLVDLLAPRNDIVVRYQGGANAGHTVVCGSEVYKLHHIPSGILSSQITNVIAPGVVIEPNMLIKEIEGLESRGIHPRNNLMISERAHVVMPWHFVEDKATNRAVVAGESIGTTNRGIGPCYRDKVGRTHAMRITDLFSEQLKSKISDTVAAKRHMLSHLAGDADLESLDADKIYDQCCRWAETLGPLAADTTNYLLDELDAGKKLLMEGAQGSLLDIDHGTYPFVTSSNASGVGVSSGSGVPAKWISNVIGVAKAYSTRVGGGPFPTELLDETGQKIREIGREYGTTTGRPRRCGWFDAVAVRYTARLSGIHYLSLMMMDVLSHFDEIQVCVAYELRGERITRFPCRAEDLRECIPVYETLPGWNVDVSKVRKLEDFPGNARKYIDRISELISVPIGVLSVGPDREQTIFLI
ncbi:MAG: adenylosuccinate synthase [Planctomycetota bacterium]|nr:adenylosuccinate synthase [Planctomycetota bacterium]